MKPSSLLIVAGVMLLLTACAPAAAPAATQVAAPAEKPAAQQPAAAPTQAAQPPGAAAPAPQPTAGGRATALPEAKPPISGGVLNPPTLAATPRNNPANIAVTPAANQEAYRETTTGLTFQYPKDWSIAVSRNNKDTLASLVLRPAQRTITDFATILIDVRPRQGELLAWLRQQLPAGRLLIDAQALEGGTTVYAAFNAQLTGRPAVFVFAPAHAKANPVAALHLADDRYFYQFTYLGNAANRAEDRTAYYNLLNTVLLSNTTTSGVKLPTTTFTAGLELGAVK